METAYISTPLGIAKLEGTENGLSAVSVLDTVETPTTIIPEVLEDATYQLQEYFEGQRKDFNLFNRAFGKNFLIFPTGKQCLTSNFQKK